MACRLSAASDPARLWFINSVQTLQSLTVLHIRATKRACSWNRLCIILFVHMHCIPFYLTPYGNQPLRQKCRQGLVKQASRFRDALKASNNLSCAGCQPQCPHTGGDASTSLVNTAFCINVHLSAIRLKRVHLFTWVRWVVWIARSIFKKKKKVTIERRTIITVPEKKKIKMLGELCFVSVWKAGTSSPNCGP